jgi:hypothetical protein
LRDSITQSDVETCLEVLRQFFLIHTCQRAEEIPTERKLQFVAVIAAHFLDMALVTFCGAHISPFDEVHLGERKFEFSIQTGLILRRRSLKCLDTYFHGRQVWVFEEVPPASKFRSHNSLYLSTTMEDFNDIWGPVWTTFTLPTKETTTINSEKQEILRFNVGLGFIIPWRNTPNEPPPEGDEIFSHWTDHEFDLHGNQPFIYGSTTKLLIGGGSRLVKNDDCLLTQNDCTLELREEGSLSHYNARRPYKERHSQTVTISMGGAGFQAGYAEEWRMREGSLLKECLLAAWANNPGERNPSIMAHWLGVEVSGCTGNARRRRLCRVLASESMQNHLDSMVMDWDGDEECKRLYFEALSDQNIRAFEELYIKSCKERREKMGTAVATCLRALMKSGVVGDQRLSAIWNPNCRDTYLATLTNRKWTGLLGDTVESCAVVVLTTDCLQFKKSVEWASSCHNSSDQKEDKGQRLFSVLETAMVVNEKAKNPKRLTLEDRRWNVKQLRPNDGFDLGESGVLKVLGLFHRTRRVMTRWTSAYIGREINAMFREKIFKKNPRSCNWERVLCREERAEPIILYVASHL